MKNDLPLLVIGAGPKAAALAAKSKSIRDCGARAPIVDIIEKHEVAANWTGNYGYTSGTLRLGTPPEKDVGFPYTPDRQNLEITRTLLRDYSWISYKALNGKYGEWIDRGRPHPTHEEWGSYIRWVIEQSGTKVIIGDIRSMTPLDSEWEIQYCIGPKIVNKRYRGVVITGPGPSKVPNLRSNSILSQNTRILYGDNFWNQLSTLNSLPRKIDEVVPIVVIGGGETAASIVSYLIDHFHQNPRSILILTRTGTIFSRGEGYYENKVFTNTGQWIYLPQNIREEIIRRADRGVFSVETSRKIAYATDVVHQHMEVIDITTSNRNRSYLNIIGRDGKSIECCLVIFALGFDTFWFTGLLPAKIKQIFSRDNIASGRIQRSIQEDLSLEDARLKAKLYLPMVAGVAQGPGFPNLSCLGDLSDRILNRS
jgi:mycobactin lysine-N-oxygenase